jgi:hypothetical protein
MQTCSQCNASSPDTALACSYCNADLREYSASAVALKKLKANPRVSKIRINVSGDACPHCFESRGTFDKGMVPALPHQGCSHEHGCRCTVEPVLTEIYP